MRKNILYLEFVLVMLFFVIPPLFSKIPDSGTINLSFSIYYIVLLLAGLILFFQFEMSQNKPEKKSVLSHLLTFGNIFFYFGILIFINMLLQGFSIAMKLPAQNLNVNVNKSLSSILIAEATFIIAAFFEEALYRLYLPSVLNNFKEFIMEKINSLNPEKELKILSNVLTCFFESTVIIIFALSHRYLGWISVFNAALCGIILRSCCIKNKSIIPGFIAHFLYNSFILILTVLL